MDTSFLDSLTTLGMPLISSRPASPVVLENPPTLELAIIGIATFAIYWAAKRLLLGKGQIIAAYEQSMEESGREAA
jgi:hypothetical protein